MISIAPKKSRVYFLTFQLIKDILFKTCLTAQIIAFHMLSIINMDSKSDTKVTIKIPRPLYNSLKALIADSGFNSVNDFVVYILRDIAAITKTDVNGQFENEEIETVKERLRNLGYLS